MRFIIVALGTALALASVTATPSAAQTGQQGSLSQSFNSCVELARQRGWTESDLSVNSTAVRRFVINCMQGGQARAQKRTKQKR